MHIVTTSSRNFFKKPKNGCAIFSQRPYFPATPPSTKKNPNKTLCSSENSLQLDEKIKSLAIIVAEK